MSHRVHPKVYRLREANDWMSRWQVKNNFSEYLEEDFKIRKFLENRLKDCGIQSIEIEKFSGKVNIIINASRPGLIIGRGGKGVEELKNQLEKEIVKGKSPYRKSVVAADIAASEIQLAEKQKDTDKKGKDKGKEIKIEIKEIREPWSKATLSSQWIASQLEKRLPYRRVLKQGLDKIMAYKFIKGARVEVSGRLNGAEIARREWLKKGRLPRQTLRADIDYGTAQAYCTFGVIGVKVWIYKGDKF